MTTIELDDRPSTPPEVPADAPPAPLPAAAPPPPPPGPPPRSPAEIEEERELPPSRSREVPADVRDLLEQFGEEAGYVIKIHRAYPMEDAGYQYTVPLDSSFTEEELKRTCGGRVFRLLVYDGQNKYVTCRTVRIDDVPRRDGVPITHKREGEDEKKPSEIGELAGVLREMLTRQQAAQERQQALIEKLLLEGGGDGGGDQPDAIGVLEQTAAVIAAVREMAPQVGAGDAGAGDGSSALMLKFGEKLLDKLDGKKEEKREAPPSEKKITIVRRAPPGPRAPAPGRPASPPEPPLPAAAAPPPPAPPPSAASAPPPASPLSAVPDDSEGVDDSSTDEELEISRYEMLEGLASLPLEEAAQIVRGLFHKLTPEDQEKAVKIIIS